MDAGARQTLTSHYVNKGFHAKCVSDWDGLQWLWPTKHGVRGVTGTILAVTGTSFPDS